MATRKKYPDELREHAVGMVFEIREREGKGRGELAASHASWVLATRLCGRGCSGRRLTAGRGPG